MLNFLTFYQLIYLCKSMSSDNLSCLSGITLNNLNIDPVL